MIEIKNINFGYEKKSKNNKNEILHSISAQIPENKITIIAGPNGSGKSTLLKILSGFLKVWTGNIFLDSENSKIDLLQLKENERAKKIAYVPQIQNIPDTTVKNLVLAGRFPHISFFQSYKKLDFQIAEESMKKMGILDFAERELSDLSGGQRQKVYLAMALAQSTPILVLDEPLTYLDIRQQLDLIETIKELKNENKTIILVVHDLTMALSIADYFILMEQGRIIAQGNPAKIADFGLIDKVFGVKTEILNTENGNKYFFT